MAREESEQARYSRKKSLAARDIGKGFPAVVNPERKAAGAASFEFFCRVYQPEVFCMAWSNDHRRAIERIEQVTRGGGLFGYAMPRGSGKTSLAEAAVLWATLHGYRLFPLVIGADESSALEFMESVKGEIECNDLLLEDYPEVCYPIRCLEGIAHRANGQLCNGERTHIHWTAKELVLPTIPGSVASGAIIAVTGITGRIRGMKFKRPDGKSVRPDLVLIDDPQTDESARSPSQCETRLNILKGAVLGLAGPGKKISGIMPCTVVQRGDLADQVLDRQKHPEWQGERTKLVYKFPENTALWEQYNSVRASSLRGGNGGREATEFYRANREAMDAGSEVAWPVRHNGEELSAIQHAMNLRADLGDRAFFSEYQNDPIAEDGARGEYLNAEEIAAKLNGKPRGVAPSESIKLTAFVDVQKAALPWMVCAWENDFTGYVVDYGYFPDQNRDFFALADVRRTLAKAMGTDSLEATIYQGLSALSAVLLSREWQRDDGTPAKVDKCLVDSNWGESTDVVNKWCRETPHASTVSPSQGVYVGALTTPWLEYKPKPGDETGDHWRRAVPKERRTLRTTRFDANHWKTFVQERLAVPIGGRGCLSIFGSDSATHRLLAAHLTSETGTKVTAKERTVTEWKIKPTRPDNHWFDCLVGCAVGASMLRISLAEREPPKAKAVKRVKLSEIQKRKQAAA